MRAGQLFDFFNGFFRKAQPQIGLHNVLSIFHLEPQQPT
jgi:hypothetical protein